MPLKPSDQLRVRRRELQTGQLAASHPSHLLALLRRRLTAELASEKMQFHAALRIAMRRGEDLHADAGIDRQLLAQLAPEAGGERLSRLALAAGKFPEAGKVHALLAPRDEKHPAALDDRGSDDDVRVHGNQRCRGAGSYGKVR